MRERAKQEDIDELARLRILQQKDDWKELYPNQDEEFYHVTKKYLEKHLNKDILFFIERMNHKIVATCGLQIIHYMPQCNDNGKEGYLCNVFTLPEYRRQGIQTGLIKECIAFAEKNNIMELKLSSDNLEAIQMYQKQGFEQDGLMMKKEIRN